MATSSEAPMVALQAHSDDEEALMNGAVGKKTAFNRGRVVAGVAAAAVGCLTGTMLVGGRGSGKLIEVGSIIGEAESAFSCKVPEAPFTEAWEAYCASPEKKKAWYMTPACNYAGWEWGDKADDKAQAACKNSVWKCHLFDTDGKQCPKKSSKPSSDFFKKIEIPKSVNWAPPYMGYYDVSEGKVTTRTRFNEAAVDFRLPLGSEVIAGRAGKIIAVEGSHGPGGECKHGTHHKPNYVSVLAEDGTIDMYLRLSNGTIKAKVGDKVEQGALLAQSGNSGCSEFPNLHVKTVTPDYRHTIDMTFSFPCSGLDHATLVKGMAGCNMDGCACGVAPTCDYFNWNEWQKSDWNNYCSSEGAKVWAMNGDCSHYGWAADDGTALSYCSENCQVTDRNGMGCPTHPACDYNTWDAAKQADWQNYCNAAGPKSWSQNGDCSHYGWAADPNTANTYCNDNCFVASTDGLGCA